MYALRHTIIALAIRNSSAILKTLVSVPTDARRTKLVCCDHLQNLCYNAISTLACHRPYGEAAAAGNRDEEEDRRARSRRAQAFHSLSEIGVWFESRMCVGGWTAASCYDERAEMRRRWDGAGIW